MAKARLLITRFAPHAQRLADLLNERGIFCLAQPLLEVKAIDDCCKPFIKHYDFIIAISCNAVEHTHRILDGDEWPKSHYLAVGNTTKLLLEEKINHSVSAPFETFNSEGLLALPALQQLNNCSVLILRGVGGREYLKEQLLERGASVDYYESYQRVAINCSRSAMLHKWQQQNINSAIISSIELLQQLIKVVPSENESWLKSLTLYAASERILQYAQELGFQKTALLPSIADQEIIDYFTNEDSYD